MIYSAGELAQARADAAEILTDTAEVWRTGAPVSDGAGGRTTPPPTKVADYPAHLLFRTGREETGSQTRGLDVGTLLLPWNAVLRLTDTLKMNGAEWQVRATNAAETDRLLIEAAVTRVR